MGLFGKHNDYRYWSQQVAGLLQPAICPWELWLPVHARWGAHNSSRVVRVAGILERTTKNGPLSPIQDYRRAFLQRIGAKSSSAAGTGVPVTEKSEPISLQRRNNLHRTRWLDH